MVTVMQYGQYNEMYSVSKCWEKLGKDFTRACPWK